MRKDVKIGIGIGGVLLAVLIVYALVPKADVGNDLARTGESESASDELEGGIAASNAEPTESNDDGDFPRTNTAPGVRDVAQVPGGSTGRESEGPASPSEGSATASNAAGSWDWDKIMDSGIIPEEARVPLAATPDDPFASQEAANGDTRVTWSQGQSGTRQSGTLTGSETNSNTPSGALGGSRTMAPPVAADSKGIAGEHVIQQGENLSMIAAVAYGDARLYREILKANPTLDERKLKVGMRIKMPDRATVASASGGARQAVRQEAIDASTQYRVAQGDSLHKIALRLYGKASKADALYELNKDKIGDDSSRLKLGMVLKLPEPPTAAARLR